MGRRFASSKLFGVLFTRCKSPKPSGHPRKGERRERVAHAFEEELCPAAVIESSMAGSDAQNVYCQVREQDNTTKEKNAEARREKECVHPPRAPVQEARQHGTVKRERKNRVKRGHLHVTREQYKWEQVRCRTKSVSLLPFITSLSLLNDIGQDLSCF